jgi:CRISPR type I-E-associated protein CasB/Cse2
MTDSKTLPLRKVAYTFWAGLEHAPGVRAALRRVREPHLLFEPSSNEAQTRDTMRARYMIEERWKRVDQDKDAIDLARFAVVVCLLAHVKCDAGRGSFGSLWWTEEVRVPERRAERVLQSETAPFGQLRRLVGQVGGTAPVGSLVQDMTSWSMRTRQRWARDYYGQQLKEEAQLTPPEQDDPGRDKDSALGRIAVGWYLDLCERTVERADLRRCASLDEVRLTKGYHRLRLRAESLRKRPSDERLALTAGVLAQLKGASADFRPASGRRISFAELAASSKDRIERLAKGGKNEPSRYDANKGDERPRISNERFDRLLRSANDAQLFASLVRLLPIIRRADVATLAEHLAWWDDAKRKRWQTDYYSVAAS